MSLRFKDFRVRTKVMLVVGVPYIMGVVLVSYISWQALALREVLPSMLSDQETSIQVRELETSASVAGEALAEFLMTGSPSSMKRCRAALKVTGERFLSVKRALKNPELVRLWDQAGRLFQQWETSVVEPFLQTGSERPRPGAALGRAQFDGFTDMVRKLADQQESAFHASVNTAKNLAGRIIGAVIVGMFCILITAMGFIYVTSTSIVGPITEAVTLADRASKGDLTSESTVDRADEVGALMSSLGRMVDSLKRQYREVLEGVRILSGTATDVSATISQISTSSTQTSSALSKASASIENIRKAASLANQKAVDILRASRGAVEISEEGRKATQETIEKIDVIDAQMTSIAETVVRLSEHSQRIETIIAAVQDLADQSNILAVNASIEASRAADQGKGFSVVAQEIKNLADQSREATQQIGDILNETRTWISRVVMATEQAGKAVKAAVDHSVVTSKSLDSLFTGIHDTAHVMEVIQSMSDEQFAGLNQVASAMNDVEQAMNQVVESTSQMEVRAGGLTELADNLNALMAPYNVT